MEVGWVQWAFFWGGGGGEIYTANILQDTTDQKELFQSERTAFHSIDDHSDMMEAV